MSLPSRASSSKQLEDALAAVDARPARLSVGRRSPYGRLEHPAVSLAAGSTVTTRLTRLRIGMEGPRLIRFPYISAIAPTVRRPTPTVLPWHFFFRRIYVYGNRAA